MSPSRDVDRLTGGWERSVGIVWLAASQGWLSSPITEIMGNFLTPHSTFLVFFHFFENPRRTPPQRTGVRCGVPPADAPRPPWGPSSPRNAESTTCGSPGGPWALAGFVSVIGSAFLGGQAQPAHAESLWGCRSAGPGLCRGVGDDGETGTQLVVDSSPFRSRTTVVDSTDRCAERFKSSPRNPTAKNMSPVLENPCFSGILEPPRVQVSTNPEQET
jgi:hypothetical protein